MSMNQITVCGRMATDPTMTEVNGAVCTSFTVAADTFKKDESGKYIPIFYRVTAWRKLGERCAKFLHKGEPVLVVGDFSQRSYTDDSGQTRIQNQINCNSIEFLGGNKAAQPRGQDDLPI